MRTITVNILKFDELAEEAKKKARDWWRDCESQDPAWQDEHNKSLQAIVDWIGSNLPPLCGDELRTYIREHEAKTLEGGCPFTGYIDDELGLDVVRSFLTETGSESDSETEHDRLIERIESAMEKAWEAECAAAAEDDNVDESIRANDYEFHEDGSKF